MLTPVLIETCPKCSRPGRLEIVAPTGHAVVVHAGAYLPDGRRWADEACIVTREQAVVLAERLEAGATC